MSPVAESKIKRSVISLSPRHLMESATLEKRKLLGEKRKIFVVFIKVKQILVRLQAHPQVQALVAPMVSVPAIAEAQRKSLKRKNRDVPIPGIEKTREIDVDLAPGIEPDDPDPEIDAVKDRATVDDADLVQIFHVQPTILLSNLWFSREIENFKPDFIR